MIPLALWAASAGLLSAQDLGSARGFPRLESQVAACWNTGALSQEARTVQVTVAFAMTPEGVPEADSIRLTGFVNGMEDAAQEAFEAARRAVIRCGVSGYDLPATDYEQWREVELTFIAEGLRLR